MVQRVVESRVESTQDSMAGVESMFLLHTKAKWTIRQIYNQ